MFVLYSKYKKPMGGKLRRHRHDLIYILKISFWEPNKEALAVSLGAMVELEKSGWT